MRLLICVALLAVRVLAAEVEPKLVGSWQTSFKNEHGTWTLTFKCEAAGSYRTSFAGPSQLPDETGTISASAGKWSTVKANGQTDSGTYVFADNSTVTMANAGGALKWTRVAAAAAPQVLAAKTPILPAPAPPAQNVPPAPAGSAGIVADTLDVPYQLPKGMLAFLKGLDLLGQGRYADADVPLGQAADADEENSNYLAVRGGALMLAEKVEQGMPYLERALRLNPKNILAGRMMRFAWLMLGDQLKASKFYGHGSTDSFDRLILETGNDYGRMASGRNAPPQYAAEYRKNREAARKNFASIAQTFAAAFKQGDDTTARGLFALGVEQFNAREFAPALSQFEFVLSRYSRDWTSMFYHSWCLMETGSVELARFQFNYLLCHKPALAEGYLGRALCAGIAGDTGRATIDLKIAASLNAALAENARPRIQTALARFGATPPGNAQDLWNSLPALARGNKWEELVTQAVSLRLTVNAARLRADEVYQDRLRVLSFALRKEPGNTDRLSELADFLRENNEVRDLQVEDNGPVHYFRFQTAEIRELEMTTALELYNKALGIDPNHYRALCGKAAMLMKYNKVEEAEAMAQRAVQIRPDLKDAHFVLSDACHEYAYRCREQAAALRTPKTGTRSVRLVNSSGSTVGYDTEYYTIPPTPEELAKADELDRQAANLDKREEQYLQAALKAAQNTPDATYYQSLINFLHKDYEAARALLEKAVREQPENVRYRHGLANAYQVLKLENEYIEEFSRAINLQQTTAGVWLKVAYTKLERNAFKSAHAALERAKVHDPSDARIYAYLAIEAEASGQPAEAAVLYRVAMAQEEARAQLAGTSFQAGGTGPASPAEMGLTWMLRLKLARMLFAENATTAAELYMATVANESRLNNWQLSKAASNAVLPDPKRDAKHPAGQPMAATVLKHSRLLAGQALAKAGLPKEALEQLGSAFDYEARLHGGGTAYLTFDLGPSYLPYMSVHPAEQWGRLYAAEALLGAGKRDEAAKQLDLINRYFANALQHVPTDLFEQEYRRVAAKLQGTPASNVPNQPGSRLRSKRGD